MTEFHRVALTLADGLQLNGWCTDQSHPSVLFFAHGNGFCGRVYQPLLDLLGQHYDLLLLDLPGHGQSPAAEFVGWNQTAEYLWQGIMMSDDIIDGRDLHAVGHSLGGMLSMLAASEHPETFKSMVMLDPIMFPRSLLLLMHIFSRLNLTSVFHPFVKPTLRRRNGWSDRQEALGYFHGRKIFKDWAQESLESYVQYALKLEDGNVRLRCDPQLEARWFATLPEKLWPSVRKLPGPVSVFMGQDTYPFSRRAGRYAARVNREIEFTVVPGGHCFMQEQPLQVAEYVIATLEKQAAQDRQ